MAQTPYQPKKSKTKKNIMYALISISIIIVILLAVFVFYLKQNEIIIKITNFSLDNRWDNPVGVTYARWFNVTIHNHGKNNATGLLLEIKIFINGTEFRNYDIGRSDRSSSFNFTLNSGETKEFEGFILTSLDSPIVFGGNSTDEISIQARVMMGDFALDEIKIPF